MGSIHTSIAVQDNASMVFSRITSSINTTISGFEQLHSISETTPDVFDNVADGIKRSERAQEDLNEEFQKGQVLSNNMVGSILRMVGAYISLNTVVNEVRQAIEYASDLQEVQNVVDVAFGNSAGIINSWSKTAMNAYGLSELSAKRYASTMGAMLKSSGLLGNAVNQISMDLTGLAGDMASFYNLDTDEAFNKIRSGISGETEPLKQLGINMSVANLEAYAMAQGIEKSYSAMSQAEQVMLRYNYLMSVSSDAQGDFARTSDSYANQVRMLEQNWQGFTGTIASQVIPVLGSAIGLLNSGVTLLADNWSYIQPFAIGMIALTTLYTGSLLLQHAATMKAWVAQNLLNTALLANPLTWVVIAIVAVIAALYSLVAAYNNATGSAVSATGIIAGAFSAMGAFIYNTVSFLFQGFAAFANFLSNLFTDPIAAVKVLFYDLAITVLGYFQTIAMGLETLVNKIPGIEVDLTSAITNDYNRLVAGRQSVIDNSNWKEVVGSDLAYKNLVTAASNGYNAGSNFASRFATESYGSGYIEEMLDGIDTTAENTARMADAVEISNENLKYMRDIAERDAINRFTTAEITINQSNNNNISSEIDVDGFVTRITESLEEAIQTTTDGVVVY